MAKNSQHGAKNLIRTVLGVATILSVLVLTVIAIIFISQDQSRPTSGTFSSPTTLANKNWGNASARASAVGVVNDFNAGDASPSPSASGKRVRPASTVAINVTLSIIPETPSTGDIAGGTAVAA